MPARRAPASWPRSRASAPRSWNGTPTRCSRSWPAEPESAREAERPPERPFDDTRLDLAVHRAGGVSVDLASNSIIEVAVGMSFVFFVLAVFATALQEAAA